MCRGSPSTLPGPDEPPARAASTARLLLTPARYRSNAPQTTPTNPPGVPPLSRLAPRRGRPRPRTSGRPPAAPGVGARSRCKRGVEEIVAVVRAASDSLHGRHLRGLFVVLRRAGLRITEALALGEADLDQRRGSVLARHGKGRATPRSRDGRMGLGAPVPLACGPDPATRRGPVWFPVNHLLVTALERFPADSATTSLEYRRGSGRRRTLEEVVLDLGERRVGVSSRTLPRAAGGRSLVTCRAAMTIRPGTTRACSPSASAVTAARGIRSVGRGWWRTWSCASCARGSIASL
jgi:hypothetical protein